MAAQTELLLVNATGAALDPDHWGPGGVRGADKVAQRFVYALLTPLGSVPGRPDDGSPFSALAQSFRSDFDLIAAFAGAYSAAAATVKSAELTDDADTEKFGAARLMGITIDATDVTLTLAIAARDGSTPPVPTSFTIDT